MMHSVKECLPKCCVAYTALGQVNMLPKGENDEAVPGDETSYQLTAQVSPVNCELLSVYCMISMRTPLGSVTQACQD